MPFTLREIVPMTRALRDACLGIIELAHPDARPDLRDEYRAAFRSVGVITATSSMFTSQQLNQQRQMWAYLFKVSVITLSFS